MISMGYSKEQQEQGQTANIGTDTYIMLHVQGAKSPIIFRPKQRITLGRHHDLTPRKPDIDLIPYGAHDQGVSRIHAAIVYKNDEIYIMDMGSCNGTWLNADRLVAGKPHLMNDGDELRLGRLRIKVGIKVRAAMPEQYDSTDDTSDIPAIRRQRGAGMLPQPTGFEADYTSEGKEETLLIPELQQDRECKLPNFVEQVGRNKQAGEYHFDDPYNDPTSIEPHDIGDSDDEATVTKPEQLEQNAQFVRPLRRPQQ